MFSRRLAFLLSLAVVMSAAPISLASHQGEGRNDLRVTQADLPDPVVEGGFVAYTLQVTNLGPHPAQEVKIEHAMSAGTTIAASGQRWECAILPVLNRTSCFHHGALSSGKSAAMLRIVVKAPSLDEISSDETSSITSTADVSSHGTELDPDNNHSEETTTIEEGYDLTVSQIDQPEQVTSNHFVRYLVTVANRGNTEATGVELAHDISTGTVEEVKAEGWTCSSSSTSTTCTLESLSSSQEAPEVEILVKAPQTSSDSSITAVATVSGDRADRDTTDNTDTETTQLQGAGQNSATGFIPTGGGSITTNPNGQVTNPPSSGSDAFAIASSTDATEEVATSTDTTIGDAIFPAGPGGVASLFEGSSEDQLGVCAVPLVNCAGAALDVIVPPGYNDPRNPIEVNLIYDETVAPISEGDRTVFVEKPISAEEPDVKTTSVVPPCRLLGIANPSPCVDFQVRLADGDLFIRILMLSQDPKYQG